MAAADILMPRPSGPGQWLDTWQCGPLGAGLIAAVLRWAPEPSEIVASTLCPVLLSVGSDPCYWKCGPWTCSPCHLGAGEQHGFLSTPQIS